MSSWFGSPRPDDSNKEEDRSSLMSADVMEQTRKTSSGSTGSKPRRGKKSREGKSSSQPATASTSGGIFDQMASAASDMYNTYMGDHENEEDPAKELRRQRESIEEKSKKKKTKQASSSESTSSRGSRGKRDRSSERKKSGHDSDSASERKKKGSSSKKYVPPALKPPPPPSPKVAAAAAASASTPVITPGSKRRKAAAEKTAHEMAEMMSWWQQENNNANANAGQQQQQQQQRQQQQQQQQQQRRAPQGQGKDVNDDAATERDDDNRELMEWWANTGRFYESNSDAVRAQKVKDMLNKCCTTTDQQSLSEEWRAKLMQDSLAWWRENANNKAGVDRMSELEDNLAKLKKVNHLLDWCQNHHPTTAEQEHEIDPLRDSKGAEKLVKKLESLLKTYKRDAADDLSIAIDESGQTDPFRKIKLILVQIRHNGKEGLLDPDDAAKDIHDCMQWRKRHAANYDPQSSSPEDKLMYEKCKQLFIDWGLPTGVPRSASHAQRLGEKLGKDIQKACQFWQKFHHSQAEDEASLNPVEREKLRKIKHCAAGMKRFMTPHQTKKAMKEMQDILAWWRLKGPKYKPARASPEDANRFDKLRVMFAQFKREPMLAAERTAKDLHDDLNWWLRTGAGVENADRFYTSPKDKARFEKVKRAMELWQAKGAAVLSPSQAVMDAKEIGDALDRWKEIMNAPKLKSKDEIMVNKLQKVFKHFKDSKTHPESTASYMRNPKSIKEIRDTLKAWKKLGGRVDMMDMPSVTKRDKRKQMKRLLDALLEWRRSKAFDEMSDNHRAQALATEMLGGLEWWKNQSGKNFDPKVAAADIQRQDLYMRNVECCLAWLHHPEDAPAMENFKLADVPQAQSAKAVKAMEKQVAWYRKNYLGKDNKDKENAMDEQDLEDEAQYQKAKQLVASMEENKERAAAAASSSSSSLDPLRAQEAAERMMELLDWFRSTGKSNPNSHPYKIKRIMELFGQWSPDNKGTSKENKKIFKDLTASLHWWRDELDYICDPTDARLDDGPSASKERLAKLVKAARWMEKQQSDDSDDTTDRPTDHDDDDEEEEDKLLAWTQDTSTDEALRVARSMEALLDNNKVDSTEGDDDDDKLDRDNAPAPAPAVTPLDKLEKVQETVSWWEGFDDTQSPQTREEMDQLYSKYDTLKPLVQWWDRRGNDYSVRKGHMDEDQARDADWKMKEAFHWLDRHVINGEPIATAVAEGGAYEESSSEGDQDDEFEEESPSPRTPTFNKPMSEQERRAREMQDAVSQLRSNDLNLDEDDVVDPALMDEEESISPFQKTRDKETEDVAKTMENALDWLRSRANTRDFDIDDGSAASSPRKLLQGEVIKAEHKPETEEEKRVKEMEDALAWLQDNNAALGIDDNMSLDSFESKTSLMSKLSRMQKNAKAQEMENALNWLKGNDKDRFLDDETTKGSGSSIRRGDDNGPLTEEEKRAKEMAETLDMLRRELLQAKPDDIDSQPPQDDDDDDMDYRTVDDETAAAFAAIAGIELPRDEHWDEDDDDHRARALKDALQWLRENKVNADDVQDEDLEKIATLASLEMPKGRMSSKKKKKAMEDSLDYIKNNPEIDADKVDDETVRAVAKMAGVSAPPRTSGDKEEKAKTLRKALDVLKKEKKPPKLIDKEVDEDTVKAFCDVAGITPPQSRLRQKDKRKVLDQSLDWLRKNEPQDDVDDETLEAITNIARKSGQQQQEEQQEQKKPPAPARALEPEEKAKIMEQAVDWLHANDPQEQDVDDSTLRAVANVAGTPAPDDNLTPEAKSKSMKEALDRLREKKRGRKKDGQEADDDDTSNEGIESSGAPPDQLPGSTERPAGEDDDKTTAKKDALDWLRSRETDYSDSLDQDKQSAAAPKDLPSGVAERQKAMEDALDWLKSNEPPEPSSDDDDEQDDDSQDGKPASIPRGPDGRPFSFGRPDWEESSSATAGPPSAGEEVRTATPDEAGATDTKQPPRYKPSDAREDDDEGMPDDDDHHPGQLSPRDGRHLMRSVGPDGPDSVPRGGDGKPLVSPDHPDWGDYSAAAAAAATASARPPPGMAGEPDARGRMRGPDGPDSSVPRGGDDGEPPLPPPDHPDWNDAAAAAARPPPETDRQPSHGTTGTPPMSVVGPDGPDSVPRGGDGKPLSPGHPDWDDAAAAAARPPPETDRQPSHGTTEKRPGAVRQHDDDATDSSEGHPERRSCADPDSLAPGSYSVGPDGPSSIPRDGDGKPLRPDHPEWDAPAPPESGDPVTRDKQAGAAKRYPGDDDDDTDSSSDDHPGGSRGRPSRVQDDWHELTRDSLSAGPDRPASIPRGPDGNPLPPDHRDGDLSQGDDPLLTRDRPPAAEKQYPSDDDATDSSHGHPGPHRPPRKDDRHGRSQDSLSVGPDGPASFARGSDGKSRTPGDGNASDSSDDDHPGRPRGRAPAGQDDIHDRTAPDSLSVGPDGPASIRRGAADGSPLPPDHPDWESAALSSSQPSDPRPSRDTPPTAEKPYPSDVDATYSSGDQPRSGRPPVIEDDQHDLAPDSLSVGPDGPTSIPRGADGKPPSPDHPDQDSAALSRASDPLTREKPPAAGKQYPGDDDAAASSGDHPEPGGGRTPRKDDQHARTPDSPSIGPDGPDAPDSVPRGPDGMPLSPDHPDGDSAAVSRDPLARDKPPAATKQYPSDDEATDSSDDHPGLDRSRPPPGTDHRLNRTPYARGFGPDGPASIPRDGDGRPLHPENPDWDTAAGSPPARAGYPSAHSDTPEGAAKQAPRDDDTTNPSELHPLRTGDGGEHVGPNGPSSIPRGTRGEPHPTNYPDLDPADGRLPPQTGDPAAYSARGRPEGASKQERGQDDTDSSEEGSGKQPPTRSGDARHHTPQAPHVGPDGPASIPRGTDGKRLSPDRPDWDSAANPPSALAGDLDAPEEEQTTDGATDSLVANRETSRGMRPLTTDAMNVGPDEPASSPRGPVGQPRPSNRPDHDSAFVHPRPQAASLAEHGNSAEPQRAGMQEPGAESIGKPQPALQQIQDGSGVLPEEYGGGSRGRPTSSADGTMNIDPGQPASTPRGSGDQPLPPDHPDLDSAADRSPPQTVIPAARGTSDATQMPTKESRRGVNLMEDHGAESRAAPSETVGPTPHGTNLHTDQPTSVPRRHDDRPQPVEHADWDSTPAHHPSRTASPETDDTTDEPQEAPQQDQDGSGDLAEDYGVGSRGPPSSSARGTMQVETDQPTSMPRGPDGRPLSPDHPDSEYEEILEYDDEYSEYEEEVMDESEEYEVEIIEEEEERPAAPSGPAPSAATAHAAALPDLETTRSPPQTAMPAAYGSSDATQRAAAEEPGGATHLTEDNRVDTGGPTRSAANVGDDGPDQHLPPQHPDRYSAADQERPKPGTHSTGDEPQIAAKREIHDVADLAVEDRGWPSSATGAPAPDATDDGIGQPAAITPGADAQPLPAHHPDQEDGQPLPAHHPDREVSEINDEPQRGLQQNQDGSSGLMEDIPEDFREGSRGQTSSSSGAAMNIGAGQPATVPQGPGGQPLSPDHRDSDLSAAHDPTQTVSQVDRGTIDHPPRAAKQGPGGAGDSTEEHREGSRVQHSGTGGPTPGATDVGKDQPISVRRGADDQPLAADHADWDSAGADPSPQAGSRAAHADWDSAAALPAAHRVSPAAYETSDKPHRASQQDQDVTSGFSEDSPGGDRSGGSPGQTSSAGRAKYTGTDQPASISGGPHDQPLPEGRADPDLTAADSPPPRILPAAHGTGNEIAARQEQDGASTESADGSTPYAANVGADRTMSMPQGPDSQSFPPDHPDSAAAPVPTQQGSQAAHGAMDEPQRASKPGGAADSPDEHRVESGVLPSSGEVDHSPYATEMGADQPASIPPGLDSRPLSPGQPNSPPATPSPKGSRLAPKETSDKPQRASKEQDGARDIPEDYREGSQGRPSSSASGAMNRGTDQPSPPDGNSLPPDHSGPDLAASRPTPQTVVPAAYRSSDEPQIATIQEPGRASDSMEDQHVSSRAPPSSGTGGSTPYAMNSGDDRPSSIPRDSDDKPFPDEHPDRDKAGDHSPPPEGIPSAHSTADEPQIAAKQEPGGAADLPEDETGGSRGWPSSGTRSAAPHPADVDQPTSMPRGAHDEPLPVEQPHRDSTTAHRPPQTPSQEVNDEPRRASQQDQDGASDVLDDYLAGPTDRHSSGGDNAMHSGTDQPASPGGPDGQPLHLDPDSAVAHTLPQTVTPAADGTNDEPRMAAITEPSGPAGFMGENRVGSRALPAGEHSPPRTGSPSAQGIIDEPQIEREHGGVADLPKDDTGGSHSWPSSGTGEDADQPTSMPHAAHDQALPVEHARRDSTTAHRLAQTPGHEVYDAIGGPQRGSQLENDGASDLLDPAGSRDHHSSGGDSTMHTSKDRPASILQALDGQPLAPPDHPDQDSTAARTLPQTVAPAADGNSDEPRMAATPEPGSPDEHRDGSRSLPSSGTGDPTAFAMNVGVDQPASMPRDPNDETLPAENPDWDKAGDHSPPQNGIPSAHGATDKPQLAAKQKPVVVADLPKDHIGEPSSWPSQETGDATPHPTDVGTDQPTPLPRRANDQTLPPDHTDWNLAAHEISDEPQTASQLERDAAGRGGSRGVRSSGGGQAGTDQPTSIPSGPGGQRHPPGHPDNYDVAATLPPTQTVRPAAYNTNNERTRSERQEPGDGSVPEEHLYGTDQPASVPQGPDSQPRSPDHSEWDSPASHPPPLAGIPAAHETSDKPRRDGSGWDWNLNRPRGEGSRVAQPRDDHQEWDWKSNRPGPGADDAGPYLVQSSESAVPSVDPVQAHGGQPGWDMNRNMPHPREDNSSPHLVQSRECAERSGYHGQARDRPDDRRGSDVNRNRPHAGQDGPAPQSPESAEAHRERGQEGDFHEGHPSWDRTYSTPHHANDAPTPYPMRSPESSELPGVPGQSGQPLGDHQRWDMNRSRPPPGDYGPTQAPESTPAHRGPNQGHGPPGDYTTGDWYQNMPHPTEVGPTPYLMQSPEIANRPPPGDYGPTGYPGQALESAQTHREPRQAHGPPGDYTAGDWNQNRGPPREVGPSPYPLQSPEFANRPPPGDYGPTGYPTQTPESTVYAGPRQAYGPPGDYTRADWSQNRPPPTEVGPTPYQTRDHPGAHPGWDWNNNRPSPAPHSGWDWNDNRPSPEPSPHPMQSRDFAEPPGEIGQAHALPGDHTGWDWQRSSDPTPSPMESHEFAEPPGELGQARGRQGDHPNSDWNSNLSPPGQYGPNAKPAPKYSKERGPPPIEDAPTPMHSHEPATQREPEEEIPVDDPPGLDGNRVRPRPSKDRPTPMQAPVTEIPVEDPPGMDGNQIPPPPAQEAPISIPAPEPDISAEDPPGLDGNRSRPRPRKVVPVPVQAPEPEVAAEDPPGMDGSSNRPSPGEDDDSDDDDDEGWDWNRLNFLISVPRRDEEDDEGLPTESRDRKVPKKRYDEETTGYNYDLDVPETEGEMGSYYEEEPQEYSDEESEPTWFWDRSESPPFEPIEPFENLDVIDESAPWASSPDDESDDGFTEKPMAVFDDLYSEPSSESWKERRKLTVLPIWMFLSAALLVAVIAGAPHRGTVADAPPPNILFDPNTIGPPTNLPKLPLGPTIPCVEDAGCQLIMDALDPVMPLQTRALINIPGTCANWSRDWLRIGRDIMRFGVKRIRQRFAMAMLYCEFNGDNWLESELWVSDLHECDWYTMIGIDPCGRHEQYQILRNYGQQLRGTLPPELSMLTALWEVTFSDNLIEGSIPSDYRKLTDLDSLSLAFNLLTGTIPEFMWRFDDMVYMDLSYNYLEGTIPDSVYRTEPNLRTLFLENNDLDGTIPTTFGRLDWARLHLDGNRFSGTIPHNINAPRIQELNLHNNELTGGFPAESFATQFAGKTSKLQQVTLYNNNIEADLNPMCQLFQTGKLKSLQVDQDKVICDCCSGPTA